jgi:tetratricopeptide (TPR) repeat protein
MPAILFVLLSFAQIAGGQTPREPLSGKEAYDRALTLESAGNHPAALALLWYAAGTAPRDPDVQNRLGEALERIGALDAAIDAYRRAVAARPAFRKAANNLILTLVKAGRGKDAIELARTRVADAPYDPDPHFTLGLALAEQDVEEAIAVLRRVLQLDPRHTLARYNLALVLRRADRLSEAVEELTREVDVEPRPESYYTLGVIYWHQGAVDRATRALRAAITLNPEYAEAYSALGSVLAGRRDWIGALEALRRAIALRPDLPGAHDTLARVLQQQGEGGAAEAAFAEADRLRTRARLEQEAGVWTAVGIRTLESGDLLRALDQFRRATALFEAYAPAHFQIGLVLRRLGEPDAARAAFARATQLNPGLIPPDELR